MHTRARVRVHEWPYAGWKIEMSSRRHGRVREQNDAVHRMWTHTLSLACLHACLYATIAPAPRMQVHTEVLAAWEGGKAGYERHLDRPI